VVYASSAAVYGVPAYLPLDEEAPTSPLSPYGLEKLIDEQYASLYSHLYGLSSLGLRYFNVYGPRQDPSSPYSGVISIFTKKIREKKTIQIFGDGSQTRDFIFVKDVAVANVQALKSDLNSVCNVATGSSVSLIKLVNELNAAKEKVAVEYCPARQGDICDSSVIPSLAKRHLIIDKLTELNVGLSHLSDWLRRDKTSQIECLEKIK
jgi:UDP-glucose 4-epimerase